MKIDEFLIARLDQAEAAAQAVVDDSSVYFRDEFKGAFTVRYGWAVQTSTTTGGGGYSVRPGAPSPEDVLADVAAKRKIIREHSAVGFEDDGTPDPFSIDRDRLYCSGCGFDSVEQFRCLLDECPTLRALAEPFSGHPDCQQEWKP